MWRVCTTGGDASEKGLHVFAWGKISQGSGLLGFAKQNKFYSDEAGMQGVRSGNLGRTNVGVGQTNMEKMGL